MKLPETLKTTLEKRFYALDVFRGATVALMILVNNPGSWDHLFLPLDHAEWEGCTLADLVFPFFLFAVGNSMAFVLPKLSSVPYQQALAKVLKRAFIIFGIGLFLNYCPFYRWDGDRLVPKLLANLRIMGVLQRIALCYCLAFLLLFPLKDRQARAIALLLLLANWGLTYWVGNGPDPFVLKHYFGTAIDSYLLGDSHLYHGEGIAFDPEGIASTPGAVVQVIIGYWAGKWALEKGRGPDMTSGLFAAGTLLLVCGHVWGFCYPVSKKIWTGSYVLFTSGIAMILLATMEYYIGKEPRHWKWWHKAADTFGKNALFVFVLSGFLPRALSLIRFGEPPGLDGKPVFVTPFGWIYRHLFSHLAPDPRIGSLAYAVGMVLFYWSIARLLESRKIFIKV